VRPLRAVLLGILALLVTAPAQAQYFGRQKVQYEQFDWRILHSDHFDIYHYPGTEAITTDAARMSERWYTRLSFAFQHEFDRKPLIFYADHPDFQQTNVVGEMISEGIGGYTEGLKNRVIMPWTGVYAENDHVLGHELVHVFQYDVAQTGPTGLGGLNTLPGWLVEGMAEYLSLGRIDANTAMWLRDAALRGELPTIRQLGRDARFFPYRYGQALWAYIAGRWGDRAVAELFRFSTRAGWEVALERVLGVTSEQISQEWIESIRTAYLPAIQGRQRPEDAGMPVLTEDELGAMYLSPAVSPDGRYVAFFGREEIFTVDLYLADARTGEVIRQLASPQNSPHFDALSFLQTAGAWSPDGRQFAYVTFEEGDNRIEIVDVESGDVVRRVRPQGIGAISSPAWSPDGRSLAFSGMMGGQGDLYLMDLESGALRQLTNDRFSNLHAAWSPDGRTLAYSTDEGPGTDFDRMIFGEQGLAVLDVTTGERRVLELFEAVKHINPQFSPDGRSLYFVANPEGFSDVYRLDLATNELFQVTRVATGISGVTALSPAMSVASQGGRMLFSVFINSGQHIYGLEPDRLAGTPVTRAANPTSVAAVLPPVEAAGQGLIFDYLHDPDRGLPPSSVAYGGEPDAGGLSYDVTDYDPSLQLDFIGPPSLGVGVSSGYGTGLIGGVSAYFSDMLGNHQVGAALQAQGELKDIGGQAIYLNSENRWNYGAMVGHIPFLTGYQAVQQHEAGFTLRQLRERVYVDQAQLLTRYPFSTTRRFEASAGYTRYGFDSEIWTIQFDQSGRQISDIIREDVPSRDPLNFVEASVAYVGDNSYFGFTSPVSGSRFRFEVSPTFGTLDYTTALADYRRYFLKQPVTFAIRGLHLGRYGEGASGFTEDGLRVMSELFLGWETLVRGYAQESWELSECKDPTPDSPCPVFDRLRGSRIAVANLELRIPLFGFSELGLIEFPYAPLEIAPFFDAGVAWSSGEEPTFEFARNTAERVPVFSTGLSARLNVLGYMVIEAYYAYPFQRPDEGWHLGFVMSPGW
jgi:dipeptidyl aminopeptidase/acylaminoacyl peptidase